MDTYRERSLFVNVVQYTGNADVPYETGLPNVTVVRKADDRMRGFVLIALGAALLLAQPAFEVASVKSSDPAERGGRIQFLPGEIFRVSNCTLDTIITRVYDVRPFQLVDAPKWISD